MLDDDQENVVTALTRGTMAPSMSSTMLVAFHVPVGYSHHVAHSLPCSSQFIS